VEPEALDQDGGGKAEQQPGEGDVPEFEPQRTCSFFARTIQDGPLGSRFLKKKQLPKRESGGNSSVSHRMRGFAKEIRNSAA